MAYKYEQFYRILGGGIFLSIQQETVDSPQIPVLSLLFLLLATPILLIVHRASYQTEVMC